MTAAASGVSDARLLTADSPTHHGRPQDHHWTTTNIGEAMPGVQTPLSWTVWKPVGVALREVGWSVGALNRAERADVDGLIEIFYGRAAFRVDPFALLGDRLPATSGREVVASLLGRVPDGLAYRPTKRRLPIIAWRFPATFVRTPRVLRSRAAEMDAWYAARIQDIPNSDRAGAVRALRDAQGRLVELVTLQTITGLAVVQPLHDALDKLVARVGTGDVGLLSGGGGAELAGVVGDIWRASRDELTLQELTVRHGFHGPLEGELSSRIWREDPAPLARMIAEYRARPDEADPVARQAARQVQAIQMRAELVARHPRWQRPAVAHLLALAARSIPLRGVAKRFLLESFDVARACSRRLGELLSAAGLLEQPEDVFYLTVDELTGTLPRDVAGLIAERRAQRSEYQRLILPSDWRGIPVPERAQDAAPRSSRNVTVSGVGVSAGVVEGRARVVLDPGFDDVEPDEILIAPTTDPSWASIMFISAALVVDIGGALSHAAVVARELGIPCVVNTRDGTRQIHTGDRVRVDGHAGTVEILR
jgi:pyruvate,water dikinase